MTVENIDFDDLPEGQWQEKEKLINITIKVSKNTKEMFGKIAHRERHNMASLGAIVLEDYMNNYIESYKNKSS